ncbi:hypothetical protein [Roseibium sp.]|uniref:hypothetical protein n=1 Tax=Roseibium sp. TaxID=1936156 RepID=UPI003A97890A
MNAVTTHGATRAHAAVRAEDPHTWAVGAHKARVKRATGPAGSVLGFAVTWSLLITGLVALELFLSEQAISGRTLAVTAIFFSGSFSGALFARTFAGLFSIWRNAPSARFAAMFIGLACGTVGLTALIHFLHFSTYYAQWHSEFGSIYWVFETLMTGASAAYIFTVAGMKFLLPWGLPLLFAAAFDYARSASAAKR